jgi:FAD/FMN-containing dehydrogenase
MSPGAAVSAGSPASHGLAADHVVASDAVTADGRHRRVDAEHEPDLCWALRGGGGSFALVTALEFTCFPITEVHAGVPSSGSPASRSSPTAASLRPRGA